MRHLTPLLIILLVLMGCTRIKTRAKENMLEEISDALSGSSGTSSSLFTGDDDPELIKSALPFALKVFEGLLEANPDHQGLYKTTASGYASYSYAFLHFPSDTLPDEQFIEKQHMRNRAKKLYLRSRNYAIDGLTLKHPDFMKKLARKSDSLLPLIQKDEIDLLYWAGLSWLGAFTVDKFDMKLALSFKSAKKLLFKVKELDPHYGDGAIDNFLITYYGGTPASMGGSLDSARHYYRQILEYQKVPTADPHISYARTVLVAEKNRDEFRAVLTKAAKIKPKADKDNILIRTIKQNEAKWLLAHENDFFLD